MINECVSLPNAKRPKKEIKKLKAMPVVYYYYYSIIIVQVVYK
jgi:hypothetical protein